MKKTLMLLALNMIFSGTLLNAERYNCPGPGNIKCEKKELYGNVFYYCTSGSKWRPSDYLFYDGDINEAQFDFIRLKGACPKQSGGECIIWGCKYSVKHKNELITYLVLEPDYNYNEKGYCTAPSLDSNFMDCQPSAKKAIKNDLGVKSN